MSTPESNPETVDPVEEAAVETPVETPVEKEVVEEPAVEEPPVEAVVEEKVVEEPAVEKAPVETPVEEAPVEAAVEEEVVEEPAEETPVHLADDDHVLELAEKEDLEGDLKDIYDLVKAKITQIVSTGKFTPDHLRPLILNIVEIIQDYTDDKYDHIDGAQKKAMALNILRQVLVDLHRNGQLNNEQYELLLLGLEFFGGALVDLAKAGYKLLVQVVDDVSTNGCDGCFKRNFRKKRKKN